jgi:diguanylate cyclase (GGDEF)-like protein/PAS domain S-box-containing protein
VYLAVSIVLAVAYWLVPPAQAKLIIWPAIGWSSVAAMVIGVRLHRPDAGSAWQFLIAGVTTFVVGDNFYSITNYIKHDVITFPSFIDPVYLAMYPLLFTGLLLLARKRAPGRDLASLLDACIITGGAGLVSWLLLIVPYFRDQEMLPLARATAVAYPLGDMALLAVAIRLAVASGRRPPAFWLLAGSVVPLLIADALYGFMNLSGTWHEHHPVDIGWIAFYVGWGVAALHPSMHELSVRSTGSTRASARRLLLVGSAAMIPPAVLFAQQLTGEITDAYAIAITGAVLFGLVLMRTSGVARAVADTRNEARFQALFDNASDAVVVVDTIGRVKYLTPSTERVLGQTPGAMLGHPLGEFLATHDERELSVLLSTSGGSGTVEWKVTGADGTIRDVEVVTADLRGDARVDGVVLTMRDISERNRLDAELRRQALHDTLTGLPNKSLFDDRVAHALGRAARSGGSVAVLFLDLDNFKVVNDSLGHSAGDELLIAVSTRLLSVLKAGDTIARFGGDEFVVLLEGANVDTAAEAVGARLHDALREPFQIGGEEFPLRASIGIAVGRADESTPSQLLRDADLAMYVAKRNGRGRSERFAPEMHEHAMRRLEVAADLPAAIVDRQLVLHYQPIVDIPTGRMRGVEALVRWNHPQRGLIMPNDFIPIAESSGVVVQLGVWVLHEACRQARAWRVAGLVDDSFYVSVNLSARHFKDRSAVDDVAAALKSADLPAHALLVEVTESALVDAVDAGLFRELRELGVRLAIDDFGTGYSSLGRLSDLPVDVVKIDKSFVDRLCDGADGDTMVRAVIALSHSLGMHAIAEGVEQQHQADALTRLGCAMAQGYLYARPIPADTITAALQATTQDALSVRLAG